MAMSRARSAVAVLASGFATCFSTVSTSFTVQLRPPPYGPVRDPAAQTHPAGTLLPSVHRNRTRVPTGRSTHAFPSSFAVGRPNQPRQRLSLFTVHRPD